MKNFGVRFSKSILVLSVFAVAFMFMPRLEVNAATIDQMQLCSQVFDAEYYAATYPEIGASLNNNSALLLQHYIDYGIYEGRNASGTFNATDYMNRYPDLQAVFGNDMMAYVSHYVYSGAAEGRVATPNVNAVFGIQPVLAPINVGTPSALPYQLLGSFTTEYVPTQARGHNIEVAAANVNGTVVAPGTTFSASNSIGQRTAANGFVEAPVFINKQHAMGMGGGVCQVSSTIYAAMKTAGIPATERHAHSLPVAYLPEGWDATISWGSLDLQFVNNYGKNIVVMTTAENGKLTASLYLQN